MDSECPSGFECRTGSEDNDDYSVCTTGSCFTGFDCNTSGFDLTCSGLPGDGSISSFCLPECESGGGIGSPKACPQGMTCIGDGPVGGGVCVWI